MTTAMPTDPRQPATDPRALLAMWLRTARAHKRLSVDDVARITKIQPRILEKLETADFRDLPAEVFVRGFVRSFARCVGLEETEAVERVRECLALPPVDRPLVDPLPIIQLAPEPVVIAEPVVAAIEPVTA